MFFTDLGSGLSFSGFFFIALAAFVAALVARNAKKEILGLPYFLLSLVAFVALVSNFHSNFKMAKLERMQAEQEEMLHAMKKEAKRQPTYIYEPVETASAPAPEPPVGDYDEVIRNLQSDVSSLGTDIDGVEQRSKRRDKELGKHIGKISRSLAKQGIEVPSRQDTDAP